MSVRPLVVAPAFLLTLASRPYHRYWHYAAPDTRKNGIACLFVSIGHPLAPPPSSWIIAMDLRPLGEEILELVNAGVSELS